MAWEQAFLDVAADAECATCKIFRLAQGPLICLGVDNEFCSVVTPGQANVSTTNARLEQNRQHIQPIFRQAELSDEEEQRTGTASGAVLAGTSLAVMAVAIRQEHDRKI